MEMDATAKSQDGFSELKLQEAEDNPPNAMTSSEPPEDTIPGTTPVDRRRLQSNGYEPIPIFGKAPHWFGWQNGEITADRLDTVEARHPDHSGTGLRTGELVVIDVDLIEPRHVAAVEAVIKIALGESPLERVGKKGNSPSIATLPSCDGCSTGRTNCSSPQRPPCCLTSRHPPIH